MTHPELVTAVHEALRRILRRALKEEPPSDFNDNSKPIGDLGLDSMAGVGFLCELEGLGIKLDDDLNPFVDDAKLRARSIEQMIDFIEAHAKTGGVAA